MDTNQMRRAPSPLYPDGYTGYILADTFAEHIQVLIGGLGHLHERSALLDKVSTELIRALRSGRKVLVIGNGGSAAQAQHFATELVGRFKRERSGYAVLALTADSAVLTAIANDYGYDQIFTRQVQALGQSGDVLVALSTSGESENVVQAACAGHEQRMTVIAITGQHQSRLQQVADIAVCVPSTETPLIQELHMILLHLLCDVVEAQLAADEHGRLAP